MGYLQGFSFSQKGFSFQDRSDKTLGELIFLLSRILFSINVSSNRTISGKDKRMSARIESGGRRMAKIKEPR